MKKAKRLSYILVIFLCVSIVSISIGFSAMSTTLTVNGSANFKPVDMIRVVSLEQDTLKDSEEISSKYTIDGINVLVDINSIDGYASYNVKVVNLGEVDKELSSIENEIFSNETMEYELEGMEIGDVIKAKETVEFKVIFKKKNTRSKSVENRLNAKLKFVFDDYVFVPSDYQIVFDSNGGTGTMDSIDMKYDESKKLPTNKFTNGNLSFAYWNTKKDGSGTSYKDEQEIKNINLDNKDKVTLYAMWIEYKSYAVNYKECIFKGKGVELEGDCSVDAIKDYVDTGIALFSEENYQKNFILEFTLTDIPDSRFVSGKRDTIFSALYEANNNTVGKYPGVLFRVENSKLVLHISNGRQTSTYATDVWFTKDQFINKEFKLIRYNDGDSIKFYYILGDSEPILLRDLTDLFTTFDTPLTFGANVAIDNVTPDRHTVGTLKNISFKFTNSNEVEELLKIEKTEEPEESEEPEEKLPTTKLDINGPCIFSGEKINISGDQCSDYSNSNYINTNIYLFNNDNYKRDFDISFRIDEYNSNSQEVNQTTIMNAFLERTGKGFGILLRKTSTALELIIRDGNGNDKTVIIPYSNMGTVRLVKKDNNVCYSINNESLKYAVSFDKFSAPFDVPLTFGSSINSSGVPFRFITGTLSDMHVTLGDIDKDIVCKNN